MALIPHGSRIYCDKKLDPLVTLTEETLEITLDGNSYTIPLVSGAYWTYHDQFESELPSAITQALVDQDLPLICKLGGVYDYSNNRTVLVFEHTDTKNEHTLNITGGTAYSTIIGSVHNFESFVDGTFKGSSEIGSSVLVVYSDLLDLPGNITARVSNLVELFGTTVVRQSTSTSISGSLRVVSASRLDGSISVRRKGSSQIPAQLTIPLDGQVDVGSFLTVRNVNYF